MGEKAMLKVRDILPETPLELITVRMNGPDGEENELFGYCAWDGKELISLDGDCYYLDEFISKYEYNEKGELTYWIICEWSSS